MGWVLLILFLPLIVAVVAIFALFAFFALVIVVIAPWTLLMAAFGWEKPARYLGVITEWEKF